MIPYFIIFSLILFFSLFDVAIASRKTKNLILYFIAVILIIFAGIRWKTGTDWAQYEYFFDIIDVSSLGKSGHEFFYDILLRTVNFFTKEYTGMLLVTATLIILFTFHTLRKYSVYPILSVLLLFTYSINSSGFGYRQDIAIAISFFAFQFIYKRQLVKFLVCIVCATLFHQTAIIFLVAYWFYNIKWSRKYLIVLVCSVVIGYILMSQLQFIAGLYTQSAQGKLDYYLENSDETYGAGDATTVLIRGIANRLFLLILPLFVIFTSKSPRVEDLKKIYNVFLFGFILFIVFGSVAVVFLRFTRYFDIYQILVIPLTIFLAGKKHKPILILLIILYLAIKFISLIFGDKDIYVPYMTIFDL